MFALLVSLDVNLDRKISMKSRRRAKFWIWTRKYDVVTHRWTNLGIMAPVVSCTIGTGKFAPNRYFHDNFASSRA